MEGVTLTIGGHDFHSVLSTYAVSYAIDHGKVVTALDGTEYAGTLTARPIVTFSVFPVTDAEAKTLYEALTSTGPIECTYSDKATNTDRTAQMRLASDINFFYALLSPDGNVRYKSGEITLRGVTCLA